MKVTKAELAEFMDVEWTAFNDDGTAMSNGSLHLSDVDSLLDDCSIMWPELIDTESLELVSIELDCSLLRYDSVRCAIGTYAFRMPADGSIDFNKVLRGWLKQKRKTSTSYICEVGADNLAAFEDAMKALNIKIKKV